MRQGCLGEIILGLKFVSILKGLSQMSDSVSSEE